MRRLILAIPAGVLAGAATLGIGARAAPAPSAPLAAHSMHVAHDESTTTVILVRHAEKQPGPGADPGLDERGLARAGALADALADAGVAAIFTSQLARTRQTAEPLAARLGLSPIPVSVASPPDAHAAQIAAEIRSSWAGRTVLVVGHSNTVPTIIRELGLPNPPAIAEDEFDRMFVLQVPASGSPRLIRARYGG